MAFVQTGKNTAEFRNDDTGALERNVVRCEHGAACNGSGWYDPGAYRECAKCRGWEICDGEVCQGRGRFDPEYTDECYLCANPPADWEETESDPQAYAPKHAGAEMADEIAARRGGRKPRADDFIPADTGDFAKDYGL